MPADAWKLRTALRVARPKEPSTLMPAPALLSRFWRSLTALPRLPRRSFGVELTEVVFLEVAAEPAPELSLFQVRGPTTPSTPIPADDWKLRTAVCVLRPKTPSALMFAPVALSMFWRFTTALPREPGRSFGVLFTAVGLFATRAERVRAPTTPSTPIPADDWNVTTALRVFRPKEPSTLMLAPWWLRRD